jgi:hypothetical protein
MHAGHCFIVAGAMLGTVLTTSHHALAQTDAGAVETWACTDASAADQKPVQYTLQGSDLVAQPLGAPRYRVLDNTSYGFVAVDYSADLDPLLGFMRIFVSTMVVDRASGHLSKTASESGRMPSLHTGHCQRVEAQADATTGSAATQK